MTLEFNSVSLFSSFKFGDFKIKNSNFHPNFLNVSDILSNWR